ncbi:MAG: hypothetical protein JNK25_11465 [Phycisphaerae bacterium]|nr:hypothetical protein [Phycisphaerae bacterium]
MPIALALGHPVPVLAADEIEVTFRYAARPSGGGVDALGPPTGAIFFDEGTDFEIEVPADFVDSGTNRTRPCSPHHPSGRSPVVERFGGAASRRHRLRTTTPPSRKVFSFA